MAISEHRTQIYLPQTLFLHLQKEARLEKKSVAQAIREAIEIYLEQRSVKKVDWRNDPFNKMVGKVEGDTDLAAHHDNYLYGTNPL